MNKQEEKMFHEMFYEIISDEKKYGYDTLFIWRQAIRDSLEKDIKNWITEHDKRERERLLDEISNDVKMISFGKFQREYKIIYKEAYNDFISRMWEILDSKK